MTLASLALAAALTAQTPAAPLSIVGTVTYRERIALPANARLVVQVQHKDTLVSEVTMALAGQQVPIAFVAPYTDARVPRGQTVNLIAMIKVDDEVWFQTPRATNVNPLTRQRVALSLVRSRQSSIKLWDQTWVVRELEGKRVPFGERRPTLRFSKADGTLQGFSGVNQFGGTFAFTAPSLQIDPGAMTMMAGSPERMQVETQLMRVLPTVNRAAIFEGELLLQRGEKVLLRLTPERR